MANTEDKVAVKVEIPKDLDRAMEMEAVRRDVTKRQIVEEALRAFLRGKGRAA